MALVIGAAAVHLGWVALTGLALALGLAGVVLMLTARRDGQERTDWRRVLRLVGEECATLEVAAETGMVVWASPAAVRLLGEPGETPVGRPLSELRPPWAEASARRLAGAAPVFTERESAWLGAGGELVWADVVAVAVEEVSPAVTYLLLRDITDRRRLEESVARQTQELRQVALAQAEQQQRLARLEARAAGLFQHSLDAILLVETESHTITQANPAACELTGYPLEQLLWRPLSDLDPSEDLRYSRALLSAAAEGPAQRDPILLRRADGTVLHAEASRVMIVHGAYQVIQINLREAETGERARRLEETVAHLQQEAQALEVQSRRLEAANRAKSEFLAEMSHELRTPLNAVVGFSELLEGSPDPLSPRQRQFVGDIRQAGEHLLSLVSDLLDLAQIEAGRLQVQAEPLALAPLVQGVVAVAQALAQPRGMRLSAQVESPALGAWGDERRVKQVLYNLLNNAVRYSPPGTEVEVEARREGAWARVSVRDQGPGIPLEFHDRIFEDFVRLRVEGNDVAPPGTGLGLALSQRLVQAMGGKLTLDSAPGQGSEFTFLLPLYEPEPDELPAESKEKGSGAVSRREK
jgi:PAS domain S-box-containing protein